MGSDASGDMYYRNGSGVLTRIAVGSDNHVLTLNGAVPGWESASAASSIAADDITAGDAAVTVGTTHVCYENNISIDHILYNMTCIYILYIYIYIYIIDVYYLSILGLPQTISTRSRNFLGISHSVQVSLENPTSLPLLKS